MQENSEKYLPNIILGNNLRFLREQIGLRQHEIAEKLSVTRDNVTSYERGVVPKLPALLEYVNIFNIPLELICKYYLQENWINQISYEENVNLLCKPECKPNSKNEELGLQNEQNSAIPILPNEKPPMITTNDTTNDSKTEESLVVLEPQAAHGAEVWLERADALKKELRSKEEVIQALQGTIKALQGTIEAQKEVIQAQKSTFSPKTQSQETATH